MNKNRFYIVSIISILLIAVVIGFLLDRSAYTQTEEQMKEDNRLTVSVEVIKPKTRDLPRTIEIPANIEAFYSTTLYAKASGFLKSINVDIGDIVEKGEVLAVLDIPEMTNEYNQKKAALENARAEYNEAKANFKLQKITYQRTMEIWKSNPRAIAKQDVDVARSKYEHAKAQKQTRLASIENAKAELERIESLMEYSKIKAPYDGIITQRFVDPGALVQIASDSNDVTPVVEIKHIDTVRVFMHIPENDVALINKGDDAAIIVDALDGKHFEGTVTRFANSLNPNTRTMKTEIDIPNPNHLLRPGMYGNVKLVLDVREDTLTIPPGVLINRDGRKYVYVVQNETAQLVEIKTGIDTRDTIEVVSGLSGNERIILKGKDEISDGVKVTVSKS